mgnify:CR=1 FL=1
MFKCIYIHINKFHTHIFRFRNCFIHSLIPCFLVPFGRIVRTLQDDFLIPAASMNPVIFAGDKEGQNTKTQWLEQKNIKVFYGDSDNDITAAHDAGARGIRVLRASNSTYRPLPMAGKFGEEVIVNSEY